MSCAVSDSAACSNTISAPHEYFYQTGSFIRRKTPSDPVVPKEIFQVHKVTPSLRGDPEILSYDWLKQSRHIWTRPGLQDLADGLLGKDCEMRYSCPTYVLTIGSPPVRSSQNSLEISDIDPFDQSHDTMRAFVLAHFFAKESL